MVIDNLNLMRTIGLPTKANAPLVIDTDGVLAFAATFKRLQPVSRRGTQVHQLGDGMKLSQLSQSRPLDVRRE